MLSTSAPVSVAMPPGPGRDFLQQRVIWLGEAMTREAALEDAAVDGSWADLEIALDLPDLSHDLLEDTAWPFPARLILDQVC